MEVGNGEMRNSTGETLLGVQSAIQHRTLSIAGAFALRCAVELGIPDRIHAYGCQPMPLAALALSISVPPEKHPMLRRLMRLLSAQGVFALQALGDGYLLTPFSRLLVVDDGSSPNMSAYVRALLTPDLVKPWHCMSDWLMQAGGASSTKTAFETAHGGKSFWDVARERPEVGRLFDEAMASESRRTAAAAAACFPHVFRGIGTLVDVGGGDGTTVRLVAEAFPQVKCTVLDLPHVVAAAPKCELFHAVGGDMFQYVPPADAVLLKNILHDWSDEECVKILMQCKKAISASGDGGKVIIVDIVINVLGDDPKKTETGLFLDILMMIGLGGGERDESEWRKVFTEAGFANYKITPTEGTYSIIELFP